jgi:hypothetical protein
LALEKGLYKLIHRADRCDLSLFQLGLRLLQYLAVRGLPIPLLELSIAKTRVVTMARIDRVKIF